MKSKVAIIIISLLSTTVFASNIKQAQLLSHRQWTTGNVTLSKDIKPTLRPASKRLTFHPEGNENIDTQLMLWGNTKGEVGGEFNMAAIPHVSIFNDDVKDNSYTVNNTVCIFNLANTDEIGCAMSESKFLLAKGSELIDYNESNNVKVILNEKGGYRAIAWLKITKDNTDQRFTTMTEDWIQVGDEKNPIPATH